MAALYAKMGIVAIKECLNNMTDREATLFRIENPVRDYDWGSVTALPEALGVPPTGKPQAEMWLGAHPSAPSVGPQGRGLDEILAKDPWLLGASAAGFGSQLPFLMKLLAAGRPLSLQVHPTPEQARLGYERENEAGLALDDPLRSYKDRNHKPEIIVAVSTFKALCGFRSPIDARQDLSNLLGDAGRQGVAAQLLTMLGDPDEEVALRSAFEFVLSGKPGLTDLAGVLVKAAEGSPTPLGDTLRITGRHYGEDPGVIATALLNRVDLSPLEALYLDAGNVHAYLSGFGIEAMAPSDNVLRGGLTNKNVDINGLLDIVRFRPVAPTRVEGETTVVNGVALTSYYPPAEEFSVHILDLEPGASRLLEQLSGPSILVLADGRMSLSAGTDEIVLTRGQSVFQGAGQPLRVTSLGERSLVYLTSVGATSERAP